MRFDKDLIYYVDGHGDEQWIQFVGQIHAIEPSDDGRNCVVRTDVGSYYVSELKDNNFTRVTPLDGAPPNRWTPV